MDRHPPCRVWLGAAALLLALGLCAAQPPAKQTLPDSAEQSRARRIIRKLFEQEYARARTDLEAGKQLAALLLQEAKTVPDSPALRYVALREARELAAEAGDTALAYEAIGELVKGFPLDVLALKTETLVTAGGKAKVPEAHKAVAEAALALLEQALADDNYDAALRLGGVAESSAVKARSLPLLTSVKKRTQELRELEKQFQDLGPAAETLRKDPKDPAANLAMGKFLCLARGNWTRGLPMLALGDDATLKDLARRDLANPGKADEQVALADAWWELGGKAKDGAQKQLRQRAGYWYAQAAPDLKGITKTRVEKRLALVGTVPLPPVTAGPIRTFKGHTRAVQSAAFSPDGRWAVSGGDDDDLRLWDVATGKQVRTFSGHTNQVWSVAFAPGGKRIASGSDDKTVRLWDADSGKEIRTLTGHIQAINRVTFSPDGKKVLSGSEDTTLRLWDVDSGKELRRFEGHLKAVWGAAFSRDGSKIASGAQDRTLGIWDAMTGKELRTIEGHKDTVLSVAFTPDGGKVISGSKDTTIRMWDLKTGKELKQFTGHSGGVTCIVLSEDGRRMLSASQDRTARLWEVESGRELYRFEGHTDEVTSVALSPDARYCITTSYDNSVRLWGLPR